MRTLKFRAWDKKAKKMYRVGGIELALNGSIHNVRCFQRQGELWDVDIMQFTSLKDKNGKSIFQGDFFKRSVEHSPKVEFIDPKINIAECRYHYSDLFSWPKEYEVIGNIYENPKLLDKGN